MLIASISSAAPQWIYSSLATTTGACVAIVGGLLVSRLVSLSAERGGLSRRIRELTEAQSVKQSELSSVRSVRFATCEKWFEEHHLETLLVERGRVNANELINGFVPRGTKPEEEMQLALNLIGTVKNAFAAIENRFPEEIPPSTAEELREHGVDIPSNQDLIYERVSSQLASDRSKNTAHDHFSFPMISPLMPTPDIVFERHDKSIAREKELEEEIKVLASTITVLVQDSHSLGKPKYLWLAVGVLTYFAVAGAIVPLGFLAFNPTDNSIGARTLTFVLFVSGLMGVFLYIIVAIRDLQKPADS